MVLKLYHHKLDELDGIGVVAVNARVLHDAEYKKKVLDGFVWRSDEFEPIMQSLGLSVKDMLASFLDYGLQVGVYDPLKTVLISIADISEGSLAIRAWDVIIDDLRVEYYSKRKTKKNCSMETDGISVYSVVECGGTQPAVN